MRSTEEERPESASGDLLEFGGGAANLFSRPASFERDVYFRPVVVWLLLINHFGFHRSPGRVTGQAGENKSLPDISHSTVAEQLQIKLTDNKLT